MAPCPSLHWEVRESSPGDLRGGRPGCLQENSPDDLTGGRPGCLQESSPDDLTGGRAACLRKQHVPPLDTN